MTEERYKKLHDYFAKHPNMAKAINLCCSILTAAVYVIFIGVLVFLLINKEYKKAYEIVLVSGVGFLACTILRNVINNPRPYDVYPYPPVIKRDKKGCSFPSRHVFSIAIIAVCAMTVNVNLGTMLIIMTFFLGTTRVLGGVHFVKDVFAGAGIAFLWGIIGFSVLAFV